MKSLNGIIMLTMVAFLAGCAGTQQMKETVKTGFLGKDYAKLREGGEGESLMVYKNPNAKWASYNKIIVDPVQIWKDAETEDVSRADLQRLANDFWSKIRESLQKDYKIVHQPGPGVMRVTIAITEAEASNATMDTITSVIPQTRLLTGAKGMVTDGQPGFVGAASIEGKVTDAQTGVLLAAGIDRRAGTKDLSGMTNEWNDVERAYQYWADRFRYRLCKERGGKNCVEPEE